MPSQGNRFLRPAGETGVSLIQLHATVTFLLGNSETCWNSEPLVVARRQNGHGESKPLTVPKDIDLRLESAPVNVLDALGRSSSGFLHQKRL